MNLACDKAAAPRPGARPAPRLARLLLGGAALAGGPAAAMPSEQSMARYRLELSARAQAESVVLVELRRVSPPPADARDGTCAVSAVVRRVERGNLHRPGQAIVFGIPCTIPPTAEERAEQRRRQEEQQEERRRRRAENPFSFDFPPGRQNGGFPAPAQPLRPAPYLMKTLTTYPFGRAFLDAQGDLLFGQYEVVEKLP